MSEFGFGAMIDKLKKAPKTIVFTEGTDPRILEASSRLLAGNFLKPILVGNVDEVKAAAKHVAPPLSENGESEVLLELLRKLEEN